MFVILAGIGGLGLGLKDVLISATSEIMRHLFLPRCLSTVSIPVKLTWAFGVWGEGLWSLIASPRDIWETVCNLRNSTILQKVYCRSAPLTCTGRYPEGPWV